MSAPKLSKQAVQYEVARHAWEGKDLSSLTLSNGKQYSVHFCDDGVLGASRTSEYFSVTDAVKSFFMYCLKTIAGIQRRTSDHIVQGMYDECIYPSDVYDDENATIPNGSPFLTNVTERRLHLTPQEAKVINQSFNVPKAEFDVKFSRNWGTSRKTCPILNKRLNHQNAIVLRVKGKPVAVSREGLRAYYLVNFPDVNLGVKPSDIKPEDIEPLTNDNLTWRGFRDWLYQDVEVEEGIEAFPSKDELPTFVKQRPIDSDEAITLTMKKAPVTDEEHLNSVKAEKVSARKKKAEHNRKVKSQRKG
ncbi:hypothetical protein [Parashewanella tropica]|uniref:hypothetical protein n=1 Tax=Parashewanella tropica TaxID=2547970 RepID=UPI00105A971A|nr:hypothetical protein [Parashewanella tropica]